MIDIIKFTNIRVIADRLMRHPLLQNVSLEAIVQYTLDFLDLWGMDAMRITKEATIEVHNYRAQLPCGTIRVNQVKTQDGIYLKAMTGTFNGSLENPAFKIQGQMLYTNIKDTTLDISYETTPIDEDGYPLILDNAVFLRALEAFIKLQFFTIYFDQNKINANVLQLAQQDYAFRAGQLNSKMSLPSLSEMQSITNMWGKMHLTTKDFYNGFQLTGNIDTYKIH